MKIRTLLRLDILISIGTPLLVGMLILASFQELSQSIRRDEQLSAIRRTIGELHRDLTHATIDRAPAGQDLRPQAAARLARELEALTGETPQQVALQDRLQAASSRLQHLLGNGPLARLSGAERRRRVEELSAALETLRTATLEFDELIRQQLVQAHGTVAVRIFLAITTLTLLLAALALRSHLRLSRPLARLEAGLRRMRGADPDYRFDFAEQDELGDLARAFDELLDTRQEAERALAASEVKYRTLVENLPQGIFLKNLDLTYVSCNAAFAKDCGLPPAKLTGLSDFELFSREVAEEHRRIDRQVLASGETVELEEPSLHDGRPRWINKVKTPVRDQNGQIIALLGAFWDVTEQHRLREEQKRLVAILENTPDYVATADARGQITWLNPAGRQLLGVATDEDVAALTVRETHPEWAARLILEEALPTANAQGLWICENALIDRRSEREIPVLQVIIAHRDATGQLSYYSTIARDLSQRKAAEEEIRRLNRELEQRVATRTSELATTVERLRQEIAERQQTEQALRRSEALYRTLVENVDLGIALIDSDYRIVMTNSAHRRSFGHPQREIDGQPCYREFERRDQVCSHCPGTRAMRTGAAAEAESQGVRQDGSTLDVLIRAFPVEEEDGVVGSFIEVVEDITVRKAAEARLARTVTDLRRSNQELEQFAYVASHDLQEPLRMIASYVQLLARRYRGRLDQDADAFIGYAVEGAVRMQTLINDLLTFSRVGRQNEPFVVVDCEKLLATTLKGLQRAIRESDARISHDPLPRVLGNASQLGQVFQNLLGNAIKFRSDAPPQVHLGVVPTDDGWQFQLTDNGIGIEPRYFQRLFVIFQRLHGKGEYPGTGIGLAVTKKIVERHGGRIWLDSEPGTGTSFYFTLKGADPS